MLKTQIFFTSKIIRALKDMNQPAVWILFFLGFSSGLPFSLVFGTLGFWLNEIGINKATITLFSLSTIVYSFKFFWAPLVDQVKIPLLSKLGQRRSWLLITQIFIVIFIVSMALVNPSPDNGHSDNNNTMLYLMSILAFLLAVASATQDIAVDAYRIEAFEAKYQALANSGYQFGYRLALLISGAGVLILTDFFGSNKLAYHYNSWKISYLIMACLVIFGIITTLLIKEPKIKKHIHINSKSSLQLLAVFIILLITLITCYLVTSPLRSGAINALIPIFNNTLAAKTIIDFLQLAFALTICYYLAITLGKASFFPKQVFLQAYVKPVVEFIQRYPRKTVIYLLLIIGLYRVSDMVLGVIANLFYQDLLFSKEEIAIAAKTFGVVMTLAGVALGGFLATYINVMRVLLIGAILSSITNLLYIALFYHPTLPSLYLILSVDNLSAGLASVAFVTFLSHLTSIEFTATQYAIFSSMMAFIPRLIGGYSGTIIENTNYPMFFIFTTIIGLPAIILILLVGKHFSTDSKS